MLYTIERIFHPVGQGAFYSETHRLSEDSGREINIVYDCGTTKSENFIEQYIGQHFSHREIDLLFLSHFHVDHYRGIKFLKPKVIVLPLLDEYDRAIFWIANKFDGNNNIFIDNNIASAFPDSKIIYVQSVGNVPDNIEDSEPVNINSFNSGDTISSGTKLYFPHDSSWYYIPINPKLSQWIVSSFKNLINDFSLDKNKILELDDTYFDANKSKLKTIYNNIGNPNEYSMAVYSGPNILNPNIQILLRNGFILYHYPTYNLYRHIFDGIRNAGCLYLGDINLKETDHAESNVLKTIYCCLPNNTHQDLATIQVPHHGSADNFNNSILLYYSKADRQWHNFEKPLFYIISAGINNSYGHPSCSVICELIKAMNFVHIVTEDRITVFIEKLVYVI